MKLLALLSLGAAVAALPAVVDRAPRASISKTDGLKFNIDGLTKYYAGTNSYWMPFLINDNDVDVIMGHLATSGQKILRIWGFNDVKSIPGSGTVYFQSFSGSTATINTGANGLQRLDAVVKSAEKHGIKLIINLVNNWTDYGYVSIAYSQSSPADFIPLEAWQPTSPPVASLATHNGTQPQSAKPCTKPTSKPSSPVTATPPPSSHGNWPTSRAATDAQHRH
jgi:hypothetical protein